MKPFRESYKLFKDHFFRVAAGPTGTSILFSESGVALFPLYWSDQPAISVTADRDHLEDWEEEFIEDLNQLPTLSYSRLISDKGYSIKDIAAMKTHSSRSTTSAMGGAVAEASPLSVAQPAEESTQPPPVVILDYAEESPLPIAASARGSTTKRAIEEGGLQRQERPFKRALVAEDETREVVDSNFTKFFGTGQGEVVDKRLSCSNDQEKAKELGLPKSLEVLQQYAGYSLVFARAVENEFGGLAAHQ
ncbi:hypothetical protein CR513_62133, partial [Mucuna pruriens]